MNIQDRYLALLKTAITRKGFEPTNLPWKRGPFINLIQRLLYKKKLCIAKVDPQSADDRLEGRGWPPAAETMMGFRRMTHLENCMKTILSEKIQGDFFEAGCWKGGSVAFMLGFLSAYNDTRLVWAADSFQGYPAPDETSYSEDKFLFDHPEYFALSKEDFLNTIKKYDLLSEQLKVLHGWFSDTIKNSEIKNLSLIRIDVDGYKPVTDVLEPLYPMLSKGGYLLIEDYRPPGCRKAVDEFRERHGIHTPLQSIEQIESIGVFWRKE